MKTLAGRLFVPILLANVLVWITFSVQGIMKEATINLPERVREVSRRSQVLETCTTDEEAVMVARALAVYYEWSPEATILFEVWRNDPTAPGQGRRLFYNQKKLRFTYAPLIGVPDQVTSLVVHGYRYNLIRHDGPRWSLRVAIPKPRQPPHEYIIEVGSHPHFFKPLALSFAVLLVALWLATTRGLQPLRELARRVAKRPDNDLTPLGFDVCYTEIKPLAAALDAMLLQLAGSVAREQAFVQDAAQQLQRPLAEIAARVEVLAAESEPMTKQQAEQEIDRAIARTSHLIQQLLEMARVGSALGQNTQIHDVARLARQYLAKIIPTARERQITLALEAPQHVPHCLDHTGFQLIFHNLLDNAIRHGQVGGMVEVTLYKDGGDLVLCVADDGPGLDGPGLDGPGIAMPGLDGSSQPDNQDEFMMGQLVPGKEESKPGTGLGLAIVRQAALRMHATLEVGSGLHGRGCRFLIRIPDTQHSPG